MLLVTPMSRLLGIAGALGLWLSGCVAVDEAELSPAQLAAIDAADLGEAQQQIIGGTTTAAGEFPGVAALLIAPMGLCTATLIHPDWLLTAGHCVVGKTPADIQVIFDDLDIRNGAAGTKVPVAQVIMHPMYAGTIGDNDIALLKLGVSQTERTWHPTAKGPPPVGSEILQVGYGSFVAPNAGNGVQRKLVTQTAACASVGAGGVSSNTAICFAADDGNGTCFGDSGGPSFRRVGSILEVTGVTSFGANQQCTGYDVHTMVAAENGFINMHVPKTAPTSGDTGDMAAGCNAGGGSPTGVAWLLAMMLGIGVRKRLVGERRARA